VTKPDKGVWGIVTETGTGYTTSNGMFPAMFDAPNQWRVEPSGKFTRTWETDEYKASVGYARDLYKLGVFTPSSDTNNNVQSKAEFAQRKAAVRWDGFVAAARQYWDAAPTLSPPSHIRTVPPFSADGKAKPVYWFGTGSFGMTILKKAPDARIKEVLRIINYIASPFGSEEYMLVNYGIKGVHYTLDDKGNPVVTTKGKSDVNSSLWTSGKSSPPILYYPSSADFAPTMQGDEKAMFPAGTFDPTTPLYSPTNSATGALTRTFNDGLSDVVAGRRPLSDFDQLVKDWLAGGGEKIKAEYQQALQDSGAS
jgi:putative aldouronate transport system substrate-binding protein